MIETSSIEFTRWTHEAMHQAEAGLKYGFKVSKDFPATVMFLQPSFYNLPFLFLY